MLSADCECLAAGIFSAGLQGGATIKASQGCDCLRPGGRKNALQRMLNDALRVALRGRPLALRRIADQLLDKAEQGNLAYIHELVDRLDGKATPLIDRRDVPVEELADAELHLIASGRLSQMVKPKVLLIPPATKSKSYDPD